MAGAITGDAMLGYISGPPGDRGTLARPGQLGWAFSNLTTALGDVIAINETAFTAAVHDGDNIDNGWDAVIPAVAATAIAGLTVAGAWRRVAEYR